MTYQTMICRTGKLDALNPALPASGENFSLLSGRRTLDWSRCLSSFQYLVRRKKNFNAFSSRFTIISSGKLKLSRKI